MEEIVKTLNVAKASKRIVGVNVIGLVSKAGRYGGIYAHFDIVFEFAPWVFEEIKFYVDGRPPDLI